MATAPRVLDLTGGPRTTTVEVLSGPLTEFLIGLQTFQFEEAAHTFDVGVGWFDRIRTQTSPDVADALARLGPVGWGSLLGKAIVERWPTEVPPFLARVAAMD